MSLKAVFVVFFLTATVEPIAAAEIAYKLSSDASAAKTKTPSTKLVIDHDGGADDAMAIFMALLNEKYFNGPEVVAITTCHANVPEPQVYVNTRKFLDLADRNDIPIFRGSNQSLVKGTPSDFYFGHDGLGDLPEEHQNHHHCMATAQSKHAVLALIDLAEKYKDDLTIVALGALTNIALAIRLDPAFISRLGHLYVGAGNLYGDAEHSKTAEFNALNDVEAYYVVAENATPDKVTVVPYSQVRISLNVSLDWRLNVLGSIPTEIMKAQNKYEQLSLQKESTWSNLDPATMAMVLDQNIVDEVVLSNNSIILEGERRGINTNDWSDSKKANVRLVYSANEDAYKKLLLLLFSAEIVS